MREPYTIDKVQEAAQKIRLLYKARGYPMARVVPKVINREQNRVDLVFEISQGQETRVQSIIFDGASLPAAGLKSVVSAKEHFWYHFFTGQSLYDKERVFYDAELLRQHYLNHGYLDVVVESPIVQFVGTKAYITHRIRESLPYRIGRIDILSQVADVPVLPIMRHMVHKTLKVGQVVSMEKLHDLAKALTRKLNEQDHSFVNVDMNIHPHEKTHKVNVVFTVQRIPSRYVRSVHLKGNLTTRDWVLRRELTFREGDPLNPLKLERSRERLEALDFFESVELQTFPGGAADEKNIEVSVKEKSTGFFRLGGGYSTNSGLLGQFSFKERNFRGTGHEVHCDASVAKRERDLTFGTTNPYFMGRRLAWSNEVFYNMYKGDTRSNFGKAGYKKVTKGAGSALSFEPKDYWFYTVGYTAKFEHIRPQENTKISPFLSELRGRYFASTVYQGLSWDKRNRLVFPSDGHFSHIRQTWAGLGGNVRYITHTLSHDTYYPLDAKKRWSLSLHLEGSLMSRLGKDLRLSDRLMLGGQNFYGFDEVGIGPRDRYTGDALGGTQRLRATPRINVPLSPNSLSVMGSLGVELGSLAKTLIRKDRNRVISDGHKLRSAAFVSVFWNSPMGMLGIVFSHTLKKHKGLDKTRNFYIAFGSDL